MLDQAGKRDDAIRTLELAIAAAPEASSSPAARVRLANLLCRKRAYPQAAAHFSKAEAAYRKNRNEEGLCDLLTARAMSRTQDPAADRADLEQAIALTEKTGNRYQNFAARLWMVTVAERDHDYQRAIRVAGEVATDAQREGMLGMAARATAELGYAYVYLRRYEQAEPILRQSVTLAERSKSYGLLASNRLKWGELLGNLGRIEESLTVLEPAIQWYRKAGVDNVLPLTLIKWGGVLGVSSRFAEAEGVFREAHALAKKSEEDLYAGMALQRLAEFTVRRNLRQAADYWEQAVVLGRRTLLTKIYFQAAEGWSQLGDFGKARKLIAEGEKEATQKYPPGFYQSNFLELVRFSRAMTDFRQGRCDQAVAGILAAPRAVQELEPHLRRMRACTAHPASLRQDLAWFESRLGAEPNEFQIANWSIYAGDLALRLKDWATAKRLALRSMEATRPKRCRVWELENTLVLRAAESQLGNHQERDRLTGEVLKMAREVGFEKPEEFGGRQDLLYFWNLGGPTPTARLTALR